LRLIGKFYADESGERTYNIMQELTRALSASTPPSPLAIPSTLFYDPIHHFIAQERVDGIPYTDLIGHPEYRSYLRLAGEGLAALHMQHTSLGNLKWLPDHITDLIHPHPVELQEQMPLHRSLVERLLDMMIEQERACKHKIVATPIHRNFQLPQLFYSQERVWLIGWDMFAKGDPALDVGNFVVYLQTQPTNRSDRAIEAFFEGYFTDSPLGLLERVPIYAAFTYLRLACERFRQQDAGWREQVQNLLLRGEECLSGKSIGRW
jgi:hypothetical protein